MFLCPPFAKGSPFVAAAVPLICFPVEFAFPRKAVEAVLIVKDEFQQDFHIPEGVTVPPGSKIECKIHGKPEVTVTRRVVGREGAKRQIKLVIVVDATVRFVVRDPEGRVITIFYGFFERRIEAIVELPIGLELVFKDLLVDCGPCRPRMDKIVCDIRVRVIFKVAAFAAFDP